MTRAQREKDRDRILQVKKDKAALVKEVLALARRGGSNGLIDACKVAMNKKLANVHDIRSIPELERVIKTAAQYMSRQELWKLIFQIRGIENQTRKGMDDDDARVVELFANGTCIYGHFRGGKLGHWDKMKTSKATSSWTCFGVLGKSSPDGGGANAFDGAEMMNAEDEMNNMRGGAAMRDFDRSNGGGGKLAAIVGCRIGTGFWRLSKDLDGGSGAYDRQYKLELRFPKGQFWAFEQTATDIEDEIKVEWRPVRPPKKIVHLADGQTVRTVYRDRNNFVQLDLDVMGKLRSEWLKWPAHNEVVEAQKTVSLMYRAMHDRQREGGKNKTSHDDSASSATKMDAATGGEGKGSDTGMAAGGDESNEAAVDLFMAVTMHDMKIVKRVLSGKDVSSLLRYRYGWDDSENTAVHQAAMYGHIDIMKLIADNVLSKKCASGDLMVTNKKMETPLHLAARRLHVDTARHLVDGMHGTTNIADRRLLARFRKFRDMVDVTDRTALRIVMERQASTTDPEIISKCSEFVWLLNSALHWQQSLIVNVRVGDEAACMIAIDSGANPNGVGDPFRPRNIYATRLAGSNMSEMSRASGPRPLHIAALTDHSNIIQLLLKSIASFISRANGELLKTHMFDAVNARDYNGATPLHLAAQAGSFECCALLIQNGAVVDARDAQRETPLHYCCKYLTANSTEVAQLLLASRADPWALSLASESTGSTGLTPLTRLPDLAACAKRGKLVFKTREVVMDLVRLHMGFAKIETKSLSLLAVGSQVEVRLLGEGGKGPWIHAIILRARRGQRELGTMNTYDVRILDSGDVVKNIDSDIRIFDFDANVNKTIDTSILTARVVPAELTRAELNEPIRGQWIPAVVDAIRYGRKGLNEYILRFADSTMRVVSSSNIRTRLPPTVESVLGGGGAARSMELGENSPSAAGVEETGQWEGRSTSSSSSIRVGQRIWTKRSKDAVLLRCSVDGCRWCITSPPRHANRLIWSSRVSMVHQHEMRVHFGGGSSKTRDESSGSSRGGRDATISFDVVVHQARNIDTLEKHAASNAFIELKFVNGQKRLNESGRVLRTFSTQVVENNDNPIWEKTFAVKDIVAKGLQMHIIAWDKTKIGYRNTCLGHHMFDFCVTIDGESVPRLGPGSHAAAPSERLILPIFQSCQLNEGTPEEAIKSTLPPVRRIGSVALTICGHREGAKFSNETPGA